MVVEVENVGIKKGIYPLSSPYNNIKYNVQLMQTSTMQDCKNGNVILAAHNGNSSVSYFDNLKNSKVGDAVNLYYHGIKYIYKLVNIYDVPKNGTVEIKRDSTKSCVTLITCKSKDKSKQVVYIGELSDTKQY
jgi:LPXTG-site transpeptidase (sortase) family protein